MLTGALIATAMCVIIQYSFKPKLGSFTNFASFNSKPAQELMSDAEYKYYTRALESLECDLAGVLLNTAFIRQYPQFQRDWLEQQCITGCLSWDVSAVVVFDEYGYCNAVSGFDQADYEVRLHGLTPLQYNNRNILDNVKYEHYWLESRDQNVAMLVDLAERDYSPALIKVGEWLRRDDVFVRSTEVEYYVLSRACFLDKKACTGLAARIATLKQVLPPERSALVEQKVSANSFVDAIYLSEFLMQGNL